MAGVGEAIEGAAAEAPEDAEADATVEPSATCDPSKPKGAPATSSLSEPNAVDAEEGEREGDVAEVVAE